MRALWLGLALLWLRSAAQDNWRDACMPHQTVGIRQLYNDIVSDSLFAVGLVTEAGDYSDLSVLRYRDGQWTTSCMAHGWIYSVARWGDTLILAGNLWGVNDVSVSRIAAFFDNAWHPFGTFGDDLGNYSIWKLRVINGVLYAVGSFAFSDGHPANGIAKRENGQWVPVGNLITEDSDPILTDVIDYHGEIYACGAVSLAPNGENGIIRFDGTNWTAPGGGILGGNAGGLCMAIYQDELVLGGTIHRSAGNPGHMIMRWNGEEWRGLGTHLRDQNNDTIGEARCYALLPYQDKLLVAGGFWYAGGVPASRFAIWDGDGWCGTGDEWEGYGESLTVFDDTLFMASGYEVNGMPVNRIAKWVGGSIEGTVCSTPVNVLEHAEGQTIAVASLGNGAFVLRNLRCTNSRYRIVDLTGRTILTGRSNSNELAVDLGPFAPGVYTALVGCTEPGENVVKLIND